MVTRIFAIGQEIVLSTRAMSISKGVVGFVKRSIRLSGRPGEYRDVQEKTQRRKWMGSGQSWRRRVADSRSRVDGLG